VQLKGKYYELRGQRSPVRSAKEDDSAPPGGQWPEGNAAYRTICRWSDYRPKNLEGAQERVCERRASSRYGLATFPIGSDQTFRIVLTEPDAIKAGYHEAKESPVGKKDAMKTRSTGVIPIPRAPVCPL
jgi:hypothetical protein